MSDQEPAGNTPVDVASVTSELRPIRDAKMGLVRLFVGLTKDGQMEPEEAEEYIQTVSEKGYITNDDAKNLNRDLDSALGRTPEQIRDAKMGLVRLFVGLTKDGQMEPEEAEEYIQTVREKGYITELDQQTLLRELKTE